MKSGLEGRNNEVPEPVTLTVTNIVSMKFGLEGRNNPLGRHIPPYPLLSQ